MRHSFEVFPNLGGFAGLRGIEPGAEQQHVEEENPGEKESGLTLTDSSLTHLYITTKFPKRGKEEGKKA